MKLPPPTPSELQALRSIIDEAGEAQNWQQAQVLGLLREAHELLSKGDWERALEVARKSDLKEGVHALSWGIARRYYTALRALYETGETPSLAPKRAHAENNEALKQSLRAEIKQRKEQRSEPTMKLRHEVPAPGLQRGESGENATLHCGRNVGDAANTEGREALVLASVHEAPAAPPENNRGVLAGVSAPIPQRANEANPEPAPAAAPSPEAEPTPDPLAKRPLHSWEIRIIRDKGVVAAQARLAGIPTQRLQDALMKRWGVLTRAEIERVLSLVKYQVHRAAIATISEAQQRRAQSKRATMQKRRELAVVLETPPKPKREPNAELSRLTAEIEKTRARLATLEELRAEWLQEGA